MFSLSKIWNLSELFYRFFVRAGSWTNFMRDKNYKFLSHTLYNESLGMKRSHSRRLQGRGEESIFLFSLFLFRFCSVSYFSHVMDQFLQKKIFFSRKWRRWTLKILFETFNIWYISIKDECYGDHFWL